MVDTHQRQTVAACGRSWGVGGGLGKWKVCVWGVSGCDWEVLIYSGSSPEVRERMWCLVRACV